MPGGKKAPETIIQKRFYFKRVAVRFMEEIQEDNMGETIKIGKALLKLVIPMKSAGRSDSNRPLVPIQIGRPF